jgi:hypothetical protein
VAQADSEIDSESRVDVSYLPEPQS